MLGARKQLGALESMMAEGDEGALAGLLGAGAAGGAPPLGPGGGGGRLTSVPSAGSPKGARQGKKKKGGRVTPPKPR